MAITLSGNEKTMASKKINYLIISFLCIYGLSFIGALIFENESFLVRIARLLTLTTYIVLSYLIYKRNNRIAAFLMALLIFLSGSNILVMVIVGVYTTALEDFALKSIYVLLGSFFVFSSIWLTVLTYKSKEEK
jgi:hypothetical protein